MSSYRSTFFTALGLASTLFLGACEQTAQIRHQLFGHTTDDKPRGQGVVVADEAQAALAGRLTLLRGGNAADAASAVALALSVTMPSRASLGGGGACMLVKPNGQSVAYSFLPKGSTSERKKTDRPASLPMTLRGLYMMQTDAGKLDFKADLDPARKLAQNGMMVSNQLAHDIAAAGPGLMNDENIRAVFAHTDGSAVRANDEIRQPQLGSFLEQVERLGVGDLYIGSLGNQYVQEANKQGALIERKRLHDAMPFRAKPLQITYKGEQLDLLPAPADGGLMVALLAQNASNPAGLVQEWRNQTKTEDLSIDDLRAMEMSFLKHTKSKPSSSLPPLPASTSFVVYDSDGMSVGCSLSDGNLFGTGRMAGLTGVVLGASPMRYPMPLYTVAHTRTSQDEIMVAASGQNSAGYYAFEGLKAGLDGHLKHGDNGAFDGGSNVVACKLHNPGKCSTQSGAASGLVAQTPLYQH